MDSKIHESCDKEVLFHDELINDLYLGWYISIVLFKNQHILKILFRFDSNAYVLLS